MIEVLTDSRLLTEDKWDIVIRNNGVIVSPLTDGDATFYPWHRIVRISGTFDEVNGNPRL